MYRIHYIDAKRRKILCFSSAIIIVILVASTVLLRHHVIPITQNRLKEHPTSTSIPNNRHFGCGMHIENIHGQDVVWELPLSPPSGIVFFAHGCHHSATDLWPPSAQCPHCLGLPEEVRIKDTILRHGLAVIAISSIERTKSRCWSEIKVDGGLNVAYILRTLLARQQLDALPLYALGASSGGELAMLLPRIMPEIRGVISEVRGLDASALPPQKELAVYPPTAFIYMPRDDVHLPMIQDNAQTLRQNNIPVLEIQVHPRPVTVDFLTERSPLIDSTLAHGIIDALVELKMIDGETGLLLHPPRPTTDEWAPIVQSVVGNLSLVLDESHVGELLNVAWAKHEAVSDGVDVALEWLKGGGKESRAEVEERIAENHQ